ncbi:triose-phosphate isomerase [Hirschia litorea]|uniref:Triosephosphate isomerase n=1 Tax=Hirschia litorea TaxID=1199156 RepID=A0ABW2II17_9PROT
MKNAKSLIVGNWKMNGLRQDIDQILAIGASLKENPIDGEVVICPPATLTALAVDAVTNLPVKIGGQDCHAAKAGAYTGDISAEKWKDIGAKYVIVGHSERRESYSEDNISVRSKAKAVLDAGLIPIICIGESLSERDSGETLSVLTKQVRECVPEEAKKGSIAIGYEPVWAIGSGKTPSVDDISEAHSLIRHVLTEEIGDRSKVTPIIYGGSMKPSNASEILAIDGVDGGLVGGASLKAEDFLSIIRAS